MMKQKQQNMLIAAKYRPLLMKISTITHNANKFKERKKDIQSIKLEIAYTTFRIH